MLGGERPKATLSSGEPCKRPAPVANPKWRTSPLNGRQKTAVGRFRPARVQLPYRCVFHPRRIAWALRGPSRPRGVSKGGEQGSTGQLEAQAACRG